MPRDTTVFTTPAVALPPWRKHGRPPTCPHLIPGISSPQKVAALAATLPMASRTLMAAAKGARNQNRYRYAVRLIWACHYSLPSRAGWLVIRHNPDDSDERYAL